MKGRRTRIVALALTLLGCTEARTQVMVVIDADDGVRADATSLRVSVSSGADFATLSPVATHDLDQLGDEWPFHLPIVPSGDDASRVFRVEVTALDASGAEIVTARRQTGFVQGQTLALTIRLESSCRGMSCAEDQSCTAGSCASAYVAPESLGPFVPPTQADDAGPGTMDAGPDAGETDAGDTDAGPPPDGALPTDAGYDAGVDGGPDAVCGNGRVDPGEACDDGVNDGAYGGCAVGCRSLAPRCGDGNVDAPMEQCDDPADVRCTSTCVWVPANCGDGIPARGELCFTAPVRLPGTSSFDVIELAMGDLDANGLDDIAFSNREAFYVFMNDGVGGLAMSYYQSGETHELTIANVNGDPQEEILSAAATGSAACGSQSCLEVGAMTGGTYTRLYADVLPVSVSSTPFEINVGYADADPAPDVVVGYSGGRFVIAYGAGTGVFGGAYVGSSVMGSGTTRGAALTTDPGAPRHLYLINDNGALEGYVLDATGRPGSLVWAANVASSLIGGRGKVTFLDVTPTLRVVASIGGSPMIQAREHLTGTMVPVPSEPPEPGSAIVAADINADGLEDLLYGDLNSPGRLRIAFNDGAGGFSPPTTLPLPCPMNTLSVGELNGDGALDVAFGGLCGPHVMLSSP